MPYRRTRYIQIHGKNDKPWHTKYLKCGRTVYIYSYGTSITKSVTYAIRHFGSQRVKDNAPRCFITGRRFQI
jgi:hypothetical protein